MVSRRNFLVGSGAVILGSALANSTFSGIAHAAPQGGPAWLEKSVMYLLYPQTFADSDGDGIGDIKGIIGRLDYLKWLGVNLIWIPPIYPSPFKDAGYDVSDYKAVASRYGTLKDFETLVKTAREKGIRILLDLVAGHTSDQHPWFTASETDLKDGRYIWTGPDHADADDLPGNYVLREGSKRGAFLHNYYESQPALNYGFARMDPEEPWRQTVDAEGPMANRAALQEIMKHWLDLGVSGFRCDMAFSLVKDDPGYAETSKIWRANRKWLDANYPEAMLISEWGYAKQSIDAGFHADFFLHNLGSTSPDPTKGGAWNSLFLSGKDPYFSDSGSGSAKIFVDTWTQWSGDIRQRGGYIALPTGNFDDANRLNDGNRGTASLKSGLVLQLTWPTLPMIYNGEEIGMKMIKGLPNKEGSDDGDPDGDRQRNRTPMQWDSTANAGFSKAPADKLYLPIDKDPKRPTVEAQQDDPDSLLCLVQRLIKLRKSETAFDPSSELRVLSTGYPFTYLRGDRYLVAVNPRRDAAEIVVDDARLGRARSVENVGTTIDGPRLQVDGFGFGIFDLS